MEEKKTESDDDKKEDVKILFLDVDGVLNYSSMGYTDPLPLSDVHLKRIGVIVESTKCKIAFSTAWRLKKKSKQKLKDSLKEIGGIDIDNVYIGSTPPPNILNKSLMKRCIEIKDFLISKKKKYNIIQYVAIDDTDLLQEAKGSDELENVMENHFVIIDGNTGITDKDVNKVIKLLNQS